MGIENEIRPTFGIEKVGKWGGGVSNDVCVFCVVLYCGYFY